MTVHGARRAPAQPRTRRVAGARRAPPQEPPTVSQSHPLVLASGSQIRRSLIASAGLDVAVDPADIDEAAAMRALAAEAPPPAIADRARRLAILKAAAVSGRHKGAIVIGADQMLELDGRILTKSADKAAARETLMALRGRVHHLHSGVALVRDGETLWSDVRSATLQVRAFTGAFLALYVDQADNALTRSVGAYELEGLGVQLFDRIEGDYFTILGLPLLPLLAELRRLGVLTS